jgi:predicted O-methyltransferase YrrM
MTAGSVEVLKWTDAQHLRVGETQFFLTTDPHAPESKSDPNRFLLVKYKRMVESLVQKSPDRVDHIVDLGIFRGGSVALFYELFKPRRLAAIELAEQRVGILDAFIEQHSLDEVIRLYYGKNQQDSELLTRIIRDDFGGAPLDLVVDDCSHKYRPTRASLNALFPHLRPGGLYIIEDWGWAHWAAPTWQRPDSQWADLPMPLTRLILELVMVSQSRPGLVKRVDIDGTTAYITRGDEVALDPSFDISECYLTADRDLLVDEIRPSVSLRQRLRGFARHH